MTKIACRQKNCSNWDRGSCSADDIMIDREGICISQDEVESLASASAKNWDVEDEFEPLTDEDGEDEDWEEDGWLDEDEGEEEEEPEEEEGPDEDWTPPGRGR